MLGIIILNFNTWEITSNCVKSILNTCKLNYRIFIVDNNSSNNSFECLHQEFQFYKNVNIIKSEINGGYAKGNNLGINAAKSNGCEFIIITNNDVTFCENSIEELYMFIKNTNIAVIVGPKIFTPNGKIQHSSILRQETFIENLGFKVYIDKIDEYSLNVPTKVYSVSGCCFIIRSKEFADMGAFDEGTFLYNEEKIIGFQTKRSSLDTYFLPSAKVIHEHGITAGKQSMSINKEFIKSGVYYWREYRKANGFLLFILWLTFTLRWLIKSIYCKELRKGWGLYFKETIKAIFV